MKKYPAWRYGYPKKYPKWRVQVVNRVAKILGITIRVDSVCMGAFDPDEADGEDSY